MERWLMGLCKQKYSYLKTLGTYGVLARGYIDKRISRNLYQFSITENTIGGGSRAVFGSWQMSRYGSHN